MVRKIVLSLFVLLFAVSLSAQLNRDSLLFRGVIMEGDSLFSLPFAKYIINNNQRYVSNEQGQFSFWARSGDVVSFSYVGFKPLYVQIHDTLAYDDFLMGVFLSRDTIELSEVVILPQRLNADAIARNTPLLSSLEEVIAQNNINISVYQAVMQSMKEWDAEMNQKNFIQARSIDVAYRTQVQPSLMLGVSSVAVEQYIEIAKLKKLKKPCKPYINQLGWKYLISSYRKKVKEDMVNEINR